MEERKEPTFAEYAEQWLKHHVELSCKPSTVTRYRDILRLHLLPAFGAVRLGQITRAMIKEFLSEKASGGRFSRDSLRLMLCTLSVIFSHAIDDELVANNPAAKLGKLTNAGKPNRQATGFTRQEANRLLQAAKEYCPRYYALFLTALRSGLRRGELGSVNTNGHNHVTMRRWNSRKLNTNGSRHTCRCSVATSAFRTSRCSTPSCMSPSMAANGAGYPHGLATGTPSTPA